MKFLSALFFLVIAYQSTAQTWQMIGDAPNAGRYDDIYFHDELLGWTVNSSGQIFRTENGGENWTMLLNSGDYLRAVRFLNDSIGVVGTLDSKVLRTTDRGDTWVDISSNVLSGSDGICGWSHFGDSFFGVGVFYEPALFVKSDDQGVSWVHQELSSLADGLVDCHFISAEVGFVSGIKDSGGVILKTENGGLTWVEVHNTQGGAEYIWKFDFVSEQTIYASVESFAINSSSRIVKSEDGGNTWVNLTVTPNLLDLQGIGFIDEERGWVCPRGTSMYETNDGGDTWEIVPGLPENINRIFRLANGDLMASGDNIYRYTTVTNIPFDPVDHHLDHAILEVSPNPFTHQFSFAVQIDKKTYAKIELYNSVGGLVKSFHDGWMGVGKYNYSVNEASASKLSSGIHSIVLRTNHGFHTAPVIRVK